jgi:hypothetical protein
VAKRSGQSILRTVKGLPYRRTLAQSLMRRGSYQIDRRHPTTQVCTSFGEFKARGGIKFAGAFLSGAQSSSPSSELDLVRVDCKRQSRIVNCLLHKTCQIQSCATCLGACDYHLRPPAPQEQNLRFSRVADTAHPSPDRQESSRFCPRVLPHFRHFSQKSALKWVQIRAPDWTYAGPGELRMQAHASITQLPITCPRIYTYEIQASTNGFQ